jgi:hypothetical protein
MTQYNVFAKGLLWFLGALIESRQVLTPDGTSLYAI